MDAFMVSISFFMAPVELIICLMNLTMFFSKLVLKLFKLRVNLEMISSKYVPCVDDEEEEVLVGFGS